MGTETQQYWLPAHIRACSTFASTVLLDLKRNRYFGVGAQETRALSTLAMNWSEANHGAGVVEAMTAEAAVPIAEALVEAGLLSREAPTDPLINSGCIDLSSTLTSIGHELHRSAPMRLAHITNFLKALAWTKHALRSRTLYSVACEISQRKASVPGSLDEQRTIELVSIFRRLRPYSFTAKDRCLFHALALTNFLSRHEIFPTWVIGVRTKPWAAHSWVQYRTLLLDANPEHICEYMPILVV